MLLRQNKAKFQEQQRRQGQAADQGGGKAARTAGCSSPRAAATAAAAAAAAGVPRAVALQQQAQQAQQHQQRAAEAPQPPQDPTKRLRAVQKKLRQVALIEEKEAAGQALQTEELAKLGQKAALEAEAAALAAA